MSDEDLWLSEEEDEYSEEDGTSGSTDPVQFNLSLAPEMESGGYHVRNRPGEMQRKAVSVFHGGSSKKPAFTVCCNAKVMIHGYIKDGRGKRATLLVYEFKFNSYRGARIKTADVMFKFHPTGGRSVGPSVVSVRPDGIHKMEETTQSESSKLSLQLQAGPEIPAVDAGVTLTKEDAVEKITKHHTVVTGDKPQSDEWGTYNQARFYLSENESQKDGIPSNLVACILLERDDDENFACHPYIQANPDLKTMAVSLFSSRAPDEPVIFDVQEKPFNQFSESEVLDRNNLGKVDMDKLWGCTMYTEYGDAVKRQD
ncbi:hypothetical protein F5Y10DRAFT_104218 [Nemania abortiva]|nr:hypothetical protein F5Y10DRAFT_104218 [Nemania abortiva]